MENHKERATQLLKFSIFQGLETDPHALEQLASLMKEETFQVRDLMIDEKKNDRKMYFLMDGQVVINKMDSGGRIVVLGKVDASSHPYFGESVLLGKFKKSANVVAHTLCRCLSLSNADFELFFKSHPAAVAVIFKNLANMLFDRVSKANQDLLILGLMLKE